MVLIRVFSDNFNGQLMTVEAYESVVLEMSTADHAMHKTETLVGSMETILDTRSVLHLFDDSSELVEIGVAS